MTTKAFKQIMFVARLQSNVQLSKLLIMNLNNVSEGTQMTFDTKSQKSSWGAKRYVDVWMYLDSAFGTSDWELFT